MNSSTGSANLSSQSSNPNYLNSLQQNSPSPVSSANAYALSIQQQQQQTHHQLQQPSQQQENTNFDQSNYGYDCNNYSNTSEDPSNSQQQQQQQQLLANQNPTNQMHIDNRIVRNPSGIQFKNEPSYSNNYLDGCFTKLPNANSTNSKSDNENDELAHDGSNISEFSSQASSFNGNDSIDN